MLCVHGLHSISIDMYKNHGTLSNATLYTGLLTNKMHTCTAKQHQTIARRLVTHTQSVAEEIRSFLQYQLTQSTCLLWPSRSEAGGRAVEGSRSHHRGMACKLVRMTDGVAHVRWSKFGFHAGPSECLLGACTMKVHIVTMSLHLSTHVKCANRCTARFYGTACLVSDSSQAHADQHAWSRLMLAISSLQLFFRL